ncbi:MAG: hypothetical protein AABX33_06065 [Nanoarchaeota archaeon]
MDTKRIGLVEEVNRIKMAWQPNFKSWYNRARKPVEVDVENRVGDHRVGIKGGRHGRAAKVYVDGERYIKDKVRLYDLTRGEKLVLSGAHGINLIAGGASTYPLKKAGQWADVVTTPSAAAYRGGKVAVEAAKDVVEILTGEQKQTINRLEQSLEQRAFNLVDASKVRDYIDNFYRYRGAGQAFDKARTTIDNEIARGARKAEKIVTDVPEIPFTRDVFEWLYNLGPRVTGKKTEDPKYHENILDALKLGKDAHDTLRYTSQNIQKEMEKPSPDLGYAVNQMRDFNKAYQILVQHNASVREGIERINPSQMRAEQRQIDPIKPPQGYQLQFETIFPLFLTPVVLAVGYFKGVRPIARWLYTK